MKQLLVTIAIIISLGCFVGCNDQEKRIADSLEDKSKQHDFASYNINSNHFDSLFHAALDKSWYYLKKEKWDSVYYWDGVMNAYNDANNYLYNQYYKK